MQLTKSLETWTTRQGQIRSRNACLLLFLGLPLVAQANLNSDNLRRVEKLSSAEEKQRGVQPVHPSGRTGAKCLDEHKERANKNIQARVEIDEAIIVPSPKSITEMSCLDKYANFSISGLIGIPSFATILDQLKNQACSLAESKISQAVAPINQSVWLPLGGRVNTGVVFGDPNKSAVDVGVGKSGDVRLPQIFK